jgi:hypothetical protein
MPEGREWAEASFASTALILSIVGLFALGILSPFGLVMADRELDAIAAGTRDPANERTAKIAKAVGAVGTTILTFAVLGVITVVGLTVG